MTTITNTETRVQLVPNDSAERKLFDRSEIGPNGACITLYGVSTTGARFNLTVLKASQAAVLEDLFRRVRYHLEQHETNGLAQPLKPCAPQAP